MSYRLVIFSVRGHKQLAGSNMVRVLDADAALPADEGTVFASLANARGYVRRELAGLSCYHRCVIVDAGGATLMVGVRSGFNGTGKRFVWADVPYEVRAGRPSYHQQRAGADCAAVSVHGTKGEADVYAERYRAANPGEPCVVVPVRRYV